MTKEALEKLNAKQANYCETLSAIIDRAKENGLKEEFERSCGKLRGFLECLCQMEIITGAELKSLYLWYFDKNRRSEPKTRTEYRWGVDIFSGGRWQRWEYGILTKEEAEKARRKAYRMTGEPTQKYCYKILVEV